MVVMMIISHFTTINSLLGLTRPTTIDAIHNSDEIVTVTITNDSDKTQPSGVAEINISTTVTIRDENPSLGVVCNPARQARPGWPSKGDYTLSYAIFYCPFL